MLSFLLGAPSAGMSPSMIKLFKQALAEQKGHGVQMNGDGPRKGSMTMHLHDV
jgi:hypothetical protein